MSVHLHLPTSTQFVTFPTEQKQTIPLLWTEGGLVRTARYYTSKCYWGTCPDAKIDGKTNTNKTGPPRPVVEKSKLSIIGETTIFIASEFIEPEFRKGPAAEWHIKDLAKIDDTTCGLTANVHNLSADKESKVAPWITLFLNDCFHYGQNRSKGKLHRWIVYHPPVAGGIRAPGMFQHRFVSAASANIAKLALSSLPELAPKKFHLDKAARLAKGAGDLGVEYLKGIAGDSLHRFLGPEGVLEAERLQSKLRAAALKPAKSEDAEARRIAEDRRVTAIQLVETLDAKEDNDLVSSAAREKERATDALNYYKAVSEQQSKTSNFWTKVFGRKAKIALNELPMDQEKSSDDEELRKQLEKNSGLTLVEAGNAIARPPTAPRVRHSLTPEKQAAREESEIEEDIDHDSGEEEEEPQSDHKRGSSGRPQSRRLGQGETSSEDEKHNTQRPQSRHGQVGRVRQIGQERSSSERKQPYDLVGSQLQNARPGSRQSLVHAPRPSQKTKRNLVRVNKPIAKPI